MTEKHMTEKQEKKAAVIAFTAEGKRLAEKIISKLQENGYQCTDDQRTMGSVVSWAGEQFSAVQVLVFVGAAGIAVRAIAPWVKDKFTDPAVVVVDEMGKFVIPILSGHLGGANEFVRMLAEFLCAVPVITTATDLRGCFAVDVFAREKGLWITDRSLAKEMSAAVLKGSSIGVFGDCPVQELPVFWGCRTNRIGEINLYLAIWKKERWEEKIPRENTLQLVPRVVTLGLGCRKDIDKEILKLQVMEALDAWGIWPQAVKKIATITLKKEEKAIQELCLEMHWELCFFSPRELAAVKGEFSFSPFVEQTTGVGNVCERAAVLGAGGRLLEKKTIKKGVALAAAR